MGMIQEFQQADAERRREVKQRHSEVATKLKELAQAGAQHRNDVTTTLRNEVVTIRNDVATMLKEFAQGDTERASEVANYTHTEVGKIRSQVTTMLKEFAQEGNGRRSAVNGIRSEVATILKELAEADDERASAVTNYMHAEVGKIRSQVADMFKDFAKEDNERRSEIAAIHQMVWGKAPARKIVATPKVAPTGAASPRETLVAAPTAADELRNRVFAYLTNHPDGTRLTELEEAFGVARIQTARVIRELIDNNKVTKRELLYFAI